MAAVERMRERADILADSLLQEKACLARPLPVSKSAHGDEGGDHGERGDRMCEQHVAQAGDEQGGDEQRTPRPPLQGSRSHPSRKFSVHRHSGLFSNA
jgi:hypothetical protein